MIRRLLVSLFWLALTGFYVGLGVVTCSHVGLAGALIFSSVLLAMWSLSCLFAWTMLHG